jgi:hypothetical protein
MRVGARRPDFDWNIDAETIDQADLLLLIIAEVDDRLDRHDPTRPASPRPGYRLETLGWRRCASFPSAVNLRDFSSLLRQPK